MDIQYVAVDWLTATTKDEGIGAYWFQLFQHFTQETGLYHFVNNKWHNGYYGGVSVDGLKWGFSENLGYIIIGSGEASHRLWTNIKVKPTKVTRIDLCVDILLREAQQLAVVEYQDILKLCLSSPKYSMFQNSHGGTTLYVGSRQSRQYGRLYDKGIQSQTAPAGRLWRYEVEIKKPLSMAVADSFFGLQNEKLEKEIVNYVGNWFADRHISSAESFINGSARPVLVQRIENTPTKKLAWLRTQVAPSVEQLIEAGLGREVFNALKLDKHYEALARHKEEEWGTLDCE